jgi:hypothetical protein
MSANSVSTDNLETTAPVAASFTATPAVAPPAATPEGPGPTAPRGDAPGFLWSFTLRDLILLALIAALVALGRSLLRLPIHVPGHSGVVWIALLVIGRGMVKKNGAGFLIGLTAGFLVTLLAPGKESVLEWTKYASAGLVLDVTTWTLGGDLRRWWAAALSGAAAHLAKLVTMTLVGLLLRVPTTILVMGLALTATTHVAFGALGGLLGALVLRELDRVPGLRGRT